MIRFGPHWYIIKITQANIVNVILDVGSRNTIGLSWWSSYKCLTWANLIQAKNLIKIQKPWKHPIHRNIIYCMWPYKCSTLHMIEFYLTIQGKLWNQLLVNSWKKLYTFQWIIPTLLPGKWKHYKIPITFLTIHTIDTHTHRANVHTHTHVPYITYLSCFQWDLNADRCMHGWQLPV